jgi:hypothetical protein
MIGYKTYAQLPAEDIPAGMPPEYPWISVEIKESEVERFKAQGFTVVSKEAYDALVASIVLPV